MDPGEGLRTLKPGDAGFSPGQCVTRGGTAPLPCSYPSVGRLGAYTSGGIEDECNHTVPT